jgi:hypothetical protein
MVLQAEMLKLAETFAEAKKELRSWLKAQPKAPVPQGKRKKSGPTSSVVHAQSGDQFA